MPAVTLGLLFAGATVYALLTPHKEITLIREGNAAAAVALGGVLVGLAIPAGGLAVSVSTSVRDIALWGVATVVVQLLVFRLVDMVLTGLPQRIQEGEVAGRGAAGRRQARHGPDPGRGPDRLREADPPGALSQASRLAGLRRSSCWPC